MIIEGPWTLKKIGIVWETRQMWNTRRRLAVFFPRRHVLGPWHVSLAERAQVFSHSSVWVAHPPGEAFLSPVSACDLACISLSDLSTHHSFHCSFCSTSWPLAVLDLLPAQGLSPCPSFHGCSSGLETVFLSSPLACALSSLRTLFRSPHQCGSAWPLHAEEPSSPSSTSSSWERRSSLCLFALQCCGARLPLFRSRKTPQGISSSWHRGTRLLRRFSHVQLFATLFFAL